MRTWIKRPLSAAAAVATLALLGSAGAAGTAAAVTPPGSGPVTAYVANYRSGTVTPINTATNHAGPAITVGLQPFDIAITRTARPPTSSTTSRTR